MIPRCPVWIFDLDNTLHDADPHIFPHINRAMQQYIETHLQLDAHAAGSLRQHYWQRYGATLLGLMRHHQTDPRHFLAETHRFHELERMVVFHHAVKAMLARLPGKKLLYSNGPMRYAGAILDITGMTPFFDAVYTVESTRFLPKPSLRGFRLLLNAEKLNPHCCVMVEDSLANLLSAKRLGLKTVWVSRSTRQPPYVDARIPSVLALPHFLRRFYRDSFP
ncbi:MAG: pyrimidine 5'-nucleotidase [Zoogloeaceae bacterium]|jgi:putative hydrolase of the HAD superfamily|nr:pyrimidine 5'-nucleotidase [Zoogloeaceae bacterium]